MLLPIAVALALLALILLKLFKKTDAGQSPASSDNNQQKQSTDKEEVVHLE
jgi:hypothetical protein